jgi:hypothetical protein
VNKGAPVTLNFPNPVRTFDAGRSCVSFWGSDASLEIAFQIEIDALRKLSVATFDAHRDTILNVAAAAYSRRKASYHRITAAEISARG